MLYSFRADIAPINSSLFIRFEIGSDYYNNHLVLIEKNSNLVIESMIT